MAQLQKVTTWLWYDRAAEEAANFYVSLVPGSKIERVTRSPIDWPNGKAGDVITVEFSLAGTRYAALNGGAGYKHNNAASLMVITEDQAETDRVWDAITKNGGKPSQCGWCSDKWGVAWQVTPRRLWELIAGGDAAKGKRAMEAMLAMQKIDVAAIEKAAG